MSRISLLVHTYIPPQHYGQTPVTHSGKVFSNFERGLLARAAHVQKHKLGEKLAINPTDNAIIQIPFIEYSFDAPKDDARLAEIIAMALQSFNLTTITVSRDDDADAVEFGAEDVEALGTGLHDWSGV